MSIKYSPARAGTRMNPIGPSQNRMARLGSHLIQLGNWINDQDAGKWFDSGVRSLQFLSRKCLDLASALRWSFIEARRKYRERQISDGPRAIGEGTGERFLRVERCDAISREDASLEVFAAIEHERERIGRDLHDGLGQMLTAIGFMSSALTHSLRATNHPDAPRADALAAMVHQLSNETRKLVRGVAKSPVEQNGLVQALNGFCADVRRWFEVDCRFECDERIGSVMRTLPVAVGTEFYRIAQEAVTNAIRHARSSQVRVRLCKVGGEYAAPAQLAMIVEDDGPQLSGPNSSVVDAGQGNCFGMGQEIMRCRARSIGATLAIRPREMGGTIVNCGLPLVDVLPTADQSVQSKGRAIASRLCVPNRDR